MEILQLFSMRLAGPIKEIIPDSNKTILKFCLSQKTKIAVSNSYQLWLPKPLTILSMTPLWPSLLIPVMESRHTSTPAKHWGNSCSSAFLSIPINQRKTKLRLCLGIVQMGMFSSSALFTSSLERGNAYSSAWTKFLMVTRWIRLRWKWQEFTILRKSSLLSLATMALTWKPLR